MPPAVPRRGGREHAHPVAAEQGSSISPVDPLLSYETILEHSHLNITVFDRDLIVRDISRSAAELAGSSRDAMRGRFLSQYLPPDYVATSARAIAGETLELRGMLPPEIAEGGVVAHAVLMPIRDPGGAVQGGVTIVADVTEQDAQRRELEKSATLLEEAEELASIGSWELDVRTGVSRCSSGWQRIHGLSRADTPLSELLPLCHPADRATVMDAIERLRTENGPVRFEHRIMRLDDGEVRHLEAYGRPALGEDGAIETVYGASLDVTDRVQAERALMERERRLRRLLAGVVSALTMTVEMRDPYTASHQERVAELALAIAQLLGWPDERVDAVHIAALLHDIGKLTVPAEILTKPSRLSRSEFEILKGHAAAAADILYPVEFDEPVHAAIRQHHERLDGSGYPDGLEGTAIIPEARLLAVADVYEAMVSHRPYRAALPRQAAIAELRDGAGGRYDSQAVEACLDLIDSGFEFSQASQ